MLLEMEGKVILVVWRQTILPKLCPLFVGKADLVSDELRCLAKGTSKQIVEGAAWCLLAAYSKM